jgi:hypothetical protein
MSFETNERLNPKQLIRKELLIVVRDAFVQPRSVDLGSNHTDTL